MRLLAVLLVASAVFADEVHLKSGGRVVGTVIEDGDPVVLKTPMGGTLRIARDKVDRIEKKPLPETPAGVPVKRVIPASPSPRHVDLFNSYAMRPPPGWRRIPASKNSKATFAAPEADGPFKLDVWVIKSDGNLVEVAAAFGKAYRDAFKGYEARWDRAAVVAGKTAQQWCGTFANDKGDPMSHVHTMFEGEKGMFWIVFAQGAEEKLDVAVARMADVLSSFELLPKLEISPENTKRFMECYQRGIEFVHEGKDAEAVGQFDICVEILPKHADSHQNLAVLHVKLGNRKRAVEEYTALVRLRPDDPAPHCDLGTQLFNDHRYADAIPRFEKALELAPDYLDAWINLGAVRTQLGEHERAVDCFRSAVEIDPQCTPALFNLGQVQSIRKRYKEAREAWEQVLKLEPEHKGAKDALKQLTQEGH
jgi:tetratricopeptide (TPR) repeat protein